MMEWNGPAGEKWFIEPIKEGVRITIVPAGSVVDDEILDVFRVGLRYASVREALHKIGKGQVYTVKDKSARIGARTDCLFLDIRIASQPGKFFHSSLDKNETRSFLEALRSLVGEAQTVTGNSEKISRNSPCPCGSGKKYKKCCMNQEKTNETDELEFARSIKDRHIEKLVEKASRNRSILKDSDFWDDLGRLIGSGGDHEKALIAFQKALMLDRNNYIVLQDLAATYECLDRHDEALKVIDRVPDKYKRKAVIRANILAGMGRFDDAIPHYEKAIKLEPGFSIPYEGLLACLKQTGNPLFEHWLQKTVEALPTHPEIALTFANFLVANNRLEEVYEADWMDHLQVRKDAFDIVGRGSQDPLCIELTRLWRLFAKIFVERDASLFKPALSLLEKLALTDQVCDHARILTILGSMLGQPDVIEKAYNHIHESCRIPERGVYPLQLYLAMAAMESKDYSKSISYCREVLENGSPTIAALEIYWRALDENEQTEEAIEAAEKLIQLDPDHGHLDYNLGHMCEKIGRLGAAKAYYEKQLQRIPDHGLALENMSVIHLMEQNFDLAVEFFNACLPHLDRYKIPDYEKIKDHELQNDLAGQVDIIVRKPKQKSFEQLLEFAKKNAGSPTYTLDIIEAIDNAEARIGNYKTEFKSEQFGLDQLIHGLSHPDDFQAKDMVYHLKTVQRGDRSATVAKLRPKLKNWEALPDNARNSLIEAEYRYLDGQTHDYSPVVVAYAKAVEVAVKKNVFDTFRSACQVGVDVDTYTKIAIYETDSRVKKLVHFVQKGTHLELGVMVLLLRLCMGKTASKAPVLQDLRKHIENRMNCGKILEKDFLDLCDDLATLRNNAAHDASYGKKTAQDAREMCFSIVQAL